MSKFEMKATPIFWSGFFVGGSHRLTDLGNNFVCHRCANFSFNCFVICASAANPFYILFLNLLICG
jgi:hypothetical protein